MRLAQLFEADHAYDPDHSLGDFKPLKAGDRVRVFHGFRDYTDALRVAQQGLTGATRVARVYSYEGDNNPKGLFVSTSMKVANEFVGAYGPRVVIEFVAPVSDLEAPVWPGGGYTVQGQMAQYFGHGAKGRRARADRRKAARAEVGDHFSGNPDFEHVTKSDDPLLASTLMANRERQALFVGHLNPEAIIFHVAEDYRAPFVAMSRDDFLAHYGSKAKPLQDWKVFQPEDTFDGTEFIARLTKDFGSHAEQVMRDLWLDLLSQPNPARAFVSTFEQYMWPKQYIDAMKWMRAHWGGRKR